MATISRLEKYWSPTQVKIYANVDGEGVWIDDAIGMDLRIEDQRTPHFGWRDTYYRDVSYGRTIVSGNLYVAFRHPNYLSDAVQNAGLQSTTPTPPSRGDSSLSERSFLPVDIADGKFESTSKDLLLQSLQDSIASYELYSKQFKAKFYSDGREGQEADWVYSWQKPYQRQSQTTTESTVSRIVNPLRAAEIQKRERKTLTVQVRYGDHTYQNEPSYTKVVHGIVLTSESHTITVLDGAGDQHLIEVYGFFARNVSAS